MLDHFSTTHICACLPEASKSCSPELECVSSSSYKPLSLPSPSAAGFPSHHPTPTKQPSPWSNELHCPSYLGPSSSDRTAEASIEPFRLGSSRIRSGIDRSPLPTRCDIPDIPPSLRRAADIEGKCLGEAYLDGLVMQDFQIRGNMYFLN